MTNERNLHFKGPGTVLSHFYNCDIDYDGINFKSVEHAYQFKKANFHYEYDLAHRIFYSADAFEAKSISKAIHSSSEWSAYKLKLMNNLIEEKHRQVPIFRQYLETTNNYNLLHNVKDDFWGTSCGYGQNRFGRLLIDVRDRSTSRLKICVFGSSYIKRVYNWCAVICFFKGGMRASCVPSELVDCRKYINRRLEKLFGRQVIFFNKIRYPKDYSKDMVHLSDSGLKTYHMQLRRLFLSLTKCNIV